MNDGMQKTVHRLPTYVYCLNVILYLNFSAQDYHNYQTAPPQQNTSYNQNVNTQYPTSYNNPNNYSAYPTTTGYEQSVDYNTMPPQQTNVDPYGYSKPGMNLKKKKKLSAAK